MFASALYNTNIRTQIQKKFYTVGTIMISAVIASMILANLSFLYRVAYTENFSVVRSSAEGFLASDQRELADELSREYDEGNILITRALQNFVTVEANIPLKSYVHESNFPYYDQALERPWVFARWVVMYNPDIQIADWRKHNELISEKWGDSEEFNYAYELIFENDSEKLFRLRDDVVKNAAEVQGIPTNEIPSLNPEIAKWDTNNVYERMGIGQVANASDGDSINEGEEFIIVAHGAEATQNGEPKEINENTLRFFPYKE